MSNNIFDLFNNARLLDKNGKKIHLKIAKGSITWDKLGDDVKERIVNNEIFLNTLYAMIQEIVSDNNLIAPGMKQYKVTLTPASGVAYSSYQSIVFEGQRYEVEVYVTDNNRYIDNITASMIDEGAQTPLTVTTIEEGHRYKISIDYVTGNIEIKPTTLAHNFILSGSGVHDTNIILYGDNAEDGVIKNITLIPGAPFYLELSPKSGYYIPNVSAEMGGNGELVTESPIDTDGSYIVWTSEITGYITITAQAVPAVEKPTITNSTVGFQSFVIKNSSNADVTSQGHYDVGDELTIILTLPSGEYNVTTPPSITGVSGATFEQSGNTYTATITVGTTNITVTGRVDAILPKIYYGVIPKTTTNFDATTISNGHGTVADIIQDYINLQSLTETTSDITKVTLSATPLDYIICLIDNSLNKKSMVWEDAVSQYGDYTSGFGSDYYHNGENNLTYSYGGHTYKVYCQMAMSNYSIKISTISNS